MEHDGSRKRIGGGARNLAAKIKEIVTEQEDVARRYRIKVVPRVVER